GPYVLDAYGNPMDQNNNLIPGEVPGDQYEARFTVGPIFARDAYGYVAQVHPYEDLEILGQPGTFTVLASYSFSAVPVNLGENTFNFYGTTHTGTNRLWVGPSGLVTFGTGSADFIPGDLTTRPSMATITPLWNDWDKAPGDPTGPMILGRFEDLDNDGVADRLVLEWNQVGPFGSGTGRHTFQVILTLNTGDTPGDIVFNYPDLRSGDAYAEGNNSTVGIKDAGTQGDRRVLAKYLGTHPFIGTGKAVLLTYVGAGPGRSGAAAPPLGGMDLDVLARAGHGAAWAEALPPQPVPAGPAGVDTFFAELRREEHATTVAAPRTSPVAISASHARDLFADELWEMDRDMR